MQRYAKIILLYSTRIPDIYQDSDSLLRNKYHYGKITGNTSNLGKEIRHVKMCLFQENR